MKDTETLDEIKKVLAAQNNSVANKIERIEAALKQAVKDNMSSEYINALKSYMASLEKAIVDKSTDTIAKMHEMANGKYVSKEEEKLGVEFKNAVDKISLQLAITDAEIKEMVIKGASKSSIRKKTKEINELKRQYKTIGDQFIEESFRLTGKKRNAVAKFARETSRNLAKGDNGLNEGNKLLEQQKILDECEEREKELYRLREKSNESLEKGKQRLSEIKTVVGQLVKEVKEGAKMWFKYDAQAISDAKKLGITTIEGARAYNTALMENSKQLSRNFGLSAEQAMKMQEVYTKVTGRATLLTRSQMEDIVSSSRLMGEETVSNAIKILDTMGTTTQTATELMDKNYARAVNNGINTVTASEEFVKNMSLANQLSFKNGVDGISKMTILSQKIRMNFQEVAKVAEKFSSIEGAIEGASQLQMLGGAGAMFGSNPMQMMYEALADPEALFERMGKMFADNANFDRTTGEARISPMQLQIMREQAKALGMNPDEAVQSAKQQARLRDAEAELRTANSALYENASQEQINKILNTAQFDKENQSWKVSYMDALGNMKEQSLSSLTASDMQQIMKDQIDPVQDIRSQVKKIATALIGSEEMLKAMGDQYKTAKAQVMDEPMNIFDKGLKWFNSSPIWGVIANGMLMGTGTMMALPMMGKMIDLRTAKIQADLIRRLGGFKGDIPLTEGGAESVVAQTKQLSSIERASGNGLGKIKNIGRLRNMAKISKAMKIGGTALAVADGVWKGYEGWQQANADYGASSYATQQLLWQGKIDENEKLQRDILAKNKRTQGRSEAVGGGIGAVGGALAGAAIGSAVIPVVGTVIGGAIGAAVGGYYGTKAGKKIGNEVGRSFEDHSKDDVINKELDKINHGDTEENVRKMVLPVESIDYNVAQIANRLGVMATPARGNVFLDYSTENENLSDNLSSFGGSNGVYPEGVQPTSNVIYTTAQGVPIDAMRVNAVDVYSSGRKSVNDSIGGVFKMEVNGSIRLEGAANCSITGKELQDLIDKNPDVKRQILEVVMSSQITNNNFGKKFLENMNNQRNTIANTNWNLYYV